MSSWISSTVNPSWLEIELNLFLNWCLIFSRIKYWSLLFFLTINSTSNSGSMVSLKMKLSWSSGNARFSSLFVLFWLFSSLFDCKLDQRAVLGDRLEDLEVWTLKMTTSEARTFKMVLIILANPFWYVRMKSSGFIMENLKKRQISFLVQKKIIPHDKTK